MLLIFSNFVETPILKVMKKIAKDLEIEKLKKQVEKLKSEKEILKREKKSLKGKLSTAQTKANKYHGALKKKRTPKDGLDMETFELMMKLLDDISTQP
mgnify:FL=1